MEFLATDYPISPIYHLIMKKIKLALLFGGRSAEHEVSIRSAKNIYEALDKNKYDITLIGIDKKGVWHDLPQITSPQKKSVSISNPQENSLTNLFRATLTENSREATFDVIFPVLHGPYGEDGTIQGMCKMLNIPFVGPDVLGSAIGMDKDVAKRLLRDSGIPVAKFLTVTKQDEITFEQSADKLGLPLFIKPANLGSSVGVSKVTDKESFTKAVSNAFQFDRKILIEESITGRELEISVLGNEHPIASEVGEIRPKNHEFYDYDAKYTDEDGAELIIPAKIPQTILKVMQDMAIRVFKTLTCEGMARVDFFLTKENKIIVNEINTIPGFTNISMYPKLWEASGIPYTELIEKLIQLAIERHQRDSKLHVSKD